MKAALNIRPFYWFCGFRSPTINRHWFTVHSRQVVCTVLSGSRLTTNYYGSLSLPLSTGTYRPTQATPPSLFLFRFPLPVTAVHCKKRLAVFPSPAGMSLTILSLAGNNLNIPDQEEFG